MNRLLCLFAAAPLARAGLLEPANSKVNVLDKDLFPAYIQKHPIVLLEFYTAWCEHCQELAPHFQEAALRLANMHKSGEIPVAVKLAKMDDGEENNRAEAYGAVARYNFTSYPSLFVFKDGEMLSRFYGGREVDEIVPFMAAISKGLDPFDEEKRTRPGLYRLRTDAVPDLSPETFNATVKRPANLDNNIVYVVMHYSDRCPHCKGMQPVIVQAAEILRDTDPRVRIVAANGRVYNELDEQNGVTGYPRLGSFYNGVKVHETNAAGSAQDIVTYAVSVADALFDASLGSAPNLLPVQYDKQNLVVLPDIATQFFLQDSAKWAAIEAEKRGAELLAEGKSSAEIETAKAEILAAAEAFARTQVHGPPKPKPLELSGMFAESIKSMGARHLYGSPRSPPARSDSISQGEL
jgi:thiol-disulfide isomerase/thioredoxin